MHAFHKGFADAIPVLCGYFAVGFAVAVTAVATNGHPLWSPVLLSLTHLSGTSQGAIIRGINFSSQEFLSFGGLVLLCVGLNLRYVLLALAVTQKIDPKTSTFQRLIMALSITDENAAIAISRPFQLTFPYLFGIFLSSYIGWCSGTIFGTLGSSLIPATALAPLSIALYAMFIAIVTPEARKSRPILFCAIAAIVFNFAFLSLFHLLSPSPQHKALFETLSMLLSGILSAAIGAFLFPQPATSDNANVIFSQPNTIPSEKGE